MNERSLYMIAGNVCSVIRTPNLPGTSWADEGTEASKCIVESSGVLLNRVNFKRQKQNKKKQRNKEKVGVVRIIGG